MRHKPLLLVLRTLLGLDVVNGRLQSDPHVPDSVGRMGLRNIGYRGRYDDVMP